MNTLREAAQQALELLGTWAKPPARLYRVMDDLRAALAQEQAVSADMRSAVRYAPSSAYWSERLREFFGPDAREGIDALERRLAEPDLSHCPQCNGPADNGHDRSFPPSPYLCTKCMAEPAQEQAEPLNLLDRAVQRRLAAQWGYVPAQAEPVQEPAMTERDHFDFARWHSRLGELADAYYAAGSTNPARWRARAELMQHALDAATGWRVRSAASVQQQAAQAEPAQEPDWRDLYLKEKQRADMWRDKYESVAGDEERIHLQAEPAQEPVAKLTTQRDALLEALKEVMRLSKSGPVVFAPMIEVHWVANQAVKAVEGEKT